MNIRTRIIVTISFQKVDNAPNAKSGSQSDYKGLQYVYCAVEKFHIVFSLSAAVRLSKLFGFVSRYEKSRPCLAAPVPALRECCGAAVFGYMCVNAVWGGTLPPSQVGARTM